MVDKEKVFGVLKTISCVEDIKDTDNLQSDLFMDSLSLVNLLIMLEEEFEIELQETDMNPFDLQTVQDVIILVEKYI